MHTQTFYVETVSTIAWQLCLHLQAIYIGLLAMLYLQCTDKIRPRLYHIVKNLLSAWQKSKNMHTL